MPASACWVATWPTQKRRASAGVRAVAAESIRLKQRFFEENANLLVDVGKRLAESLRAGGKVLVFGNGGSAADAQHFAGELVGRYLRDRSRFALTDGLRRVRVADFGYRTCYVSSRPGDRLGCVRLRDLRQRNSLP